MANRKLKVLVGCEFSGTVRDAFQRLGHDAWSCDLLPTEKPGKHFHGDVFRIVDFGWDLAIFHPPCTYLANSGAQHLYQGRNKNNPINQERWQNMVEGAEFFKALWELPIPMIAIENPIMHKYGREIIKADYAQVIQPYHFGHGETKATCLWLKGLPPLMYTYLASGRYARVHNEPSGPNRWKNRSRTYEGIAMAMAMQWGGVVN